MATQYEGKKAALRPLYDAIVAAAEASGGWGGVISEALQGAFHAADDSVAVIDFPERATGIFRDAALFATDALEFYASADDRDRLRVGQRFLKLRRQFVLAHGQLIKG